MAQPLIVIPDTHGHVRELETLLMYFKNTGYLKDHKLAFLGDYYDRGPDICRLIELCLELQRQGHIFLMGNHEYVLARILRPDRHWGYWVDRWQWDYENGTLASYGIRAPREVEIEEWKEAASILKSAMPREHAEFIIGLPFFYEDDNLILVHAGLTADPWDLQRARLELEQNSMVSSEGPAQLFSSKLAKSVEYPAQKMVVSGHALFRKPVVSPNRIMLHCGVEMEKGRLFSWVSDTGMFVKTRRR